MCQHHSLTEDTLHDAWLICELRKLLITPYSPSYTPPSTFKSQQGKYVLKNANPFETNL